MNTIQELFQQAQLAEAAYSNLSGINVSTAPSILQSRLVNLQPNGNFDFSPTQAATFASEWQVVDHIPDTAAGFSATIFRNIQTGAYTLAIRGSTDINDFVADAGIIAQEGVAIRQLVDLYNFWQRAITPAQQTVTSAAQLRVSETPFAGSLEVVAGGRLVYYGIDYVPSSQLGDATLRLGSGSMVGTPATLNVTGHSLGGHLAMAFTRLFPGIASTAQAVNGLGFKVGTPLVDYMFSRLGGQTTFNAASINNIYGIAGPEFASMNNFLLQQPGGYSGIFIENGSINPPRLPRHMHCIAALAR